MTTLRATVILKTDISESTVRLRALSEADLHTLLIEHRAFLDRHAVARDGRIVKPEGDGFWLVFPSVTAAALAAMAMQEDLRLAQPSKGDDRIALRIVITLGDVLHEEGALVGDAVVLATRIEAVTPPDEIYLSAAAWLAVNQAEIRTAFVDTLPLKGFPDPVSVYRVAQTYRTHVIKNQFIVVTDLRRFTAILETSSITTVETILDALLELTNQVTRQCGGTIRFSTGDGYCLTFPDVDPAMAAAEQFTEAWAGVERQHAFRCPINVVVHQGVLYAFRSYFYGPGLNLALGVQNASQRVVPPDESLVFVTGEVRNLLAGTSWNTRLEPLDVGSASSRLGKIEVYRLRQPGFDRK